jgi:transposase-like protein
MHFEVKSYIRRYLEAVFNLELTQQLGCQRYQRKDSRQGYRNGFYHRDLLTSYGWLGSLAVPRSREGIFYPSCLDKYRRRQRAVDRVLLESFLLGHATRKVRRLCHRVFGSAISPQAISNIVKGLDGEVKRFHRRRFADDYRFLYLDGFWIVLSRPVKVRKVLLIAFGFKADGTKELLSFQLAPSESESCWWGFLSDLKARGLRGSNLEVLVSDDAGGLVKSIRGIYPRVSHQLCTFHKSMNLKNHLINKGCRHRIVSDALHIFEGATETEVRKRLHIFIDRWKVKEARAVRNFIKGFGDCLVYLEYPEPIRRSLKTNNPIERYIQEIERRTIPMRAFNNAKSAERIVYGIIKYVLNNESDMPVKQFTQSA